MQGFIKALKQEKEKVKAEIHDDHTLPLMV